MSARGGRVGTHKHSFWPFWERRECGAAGHGPWGAWPGLRDPRVQKPRSPRSPPSLLRPALAVQTAPRRQPRDPVGVAVPAPRNAIPLVHAVGCCVEHTRCGSLRRVSVTSRVHAPEVCRTCPVRLQTLHVRASAPAAALCTPLRQPSQQGQRGRLGWQGHLAWKRPVGWPPSPALHGLYPHVTARSACGPVAACGGAREDPGRDPLPRPP